jgi:transcriptional regulator with XRE-family HTH domain
MELERRLVELRKEKNLSQEELAEKLYVSRQTISNTVFD